MENTQETQIQNVSDTALWVATYRAMETERHDALFKDPYAARLSGERGRKIAESLKETTRYTSWSVIIRTCIIDSYIENLINEGVDTIVNLGAGLDARPYRMNLPTSLRWIEVDYPSMIEHKQKILANDKPRCRLERVAMDLSQGDLRRQFLKDVNATSKNILILTEGVVPYLTEAQTAELAADLRAQDHISYWIVDYFSPKIYKYMRSQKRMEQMKNAPIQFFPEDWFSFFKKSGWKPKEIRYQAEESVKLGRKYPVPWFAAIIRIFMPAKVRQEMKQFTGYVLLTPERPAKI